MNPVTCLLCHEPMPGTGLHCSRCRDETTRTEAATDRAPTPQPKGIELADLFLAWLTQNGVAAPVTEHHFAKPRRWRFDFAWPARMVALEVEGGVWTQGRHTRGKGFVADCEKYSEAAARGWRLIRVVPGDLCTDRTLGWIRRTLALTSEA